MEDALKNRLILALIILSIICLVWTIGSCSNVHRFKAARDKEMITRLDLEERVSKLTQEKVLLDSKINALIQELEEEKVAHQASKKALLEGQLINQSLKEELQKLIKLKEALEEDLKEALVKDKPIKNK